MAGDQCGHPVFGWHPVRGYKIAGDPDEARAIGGECGPDANLFEASPPPPPPEPEKPLKWWRL
jgi:hypothetical protein